MGGRVHRFVLERGSVQDLRHIATFVEAMCAACRIEGRAAFHVKLAVDEACANVFEHGYHGQSGRLVVEGACSASLLTVHIWDWGQPFDPDAISPPDPTLSLAERPIGGLGIHLIRQVMDSVSYRFDEQGNCLTLTKRLSPPG